MRRCGALAVLLLACGGDDASTSTTDAGGDSTQVEGGGDARQLVCGNSPWVTYGHDGHRTSASDGCIVGPLTVAWRYTPATRPDGDGGTKQVLAVNRAIAESDGVFLTWGISGIPFGTTQALDRVDSTTGKSTWSFVPGFGDHSNGLWPTVGLGAVLYASDGLYWIDATTGMSAHGYGVDYWGDVLTDATQAYVTNTWFVDGPPMFVGTYDMAGKQGWQQNVFGKNRAADIDAVGAMAIDAGTLFFAGSYTFGGTPPTFVSGLYAFDPATGKQQWVQPTTPTSAIAAIDGTVFLSEGTSLVARKETDGSVLWTVPYVAPAAYGTGAAPVVTQSLVIVQEKSGVIARKKSDGSTVWNAPLSAGFYTDVTLAAALGSDTLIAVDSKVHVLALADGHEIWSGVPQGLVGMIMSSPVIIGKRLYVIDPGSLTGTTPGALIALDSP